MTSKIAVGRAHLLAGFSVDGNRSSGNKVHTGAGGVSSDDDVIHQIHLDP